MRIVVHFYDDELQTYEGINKILVSSDKIKIQVNENFDIMDIKTLENTEIDSITVFKC